MKPYIRGKYAKGACALINELRKQGISSAVGYDSDPKTRAGKLTAYVRAEDAFKVPREWRGFSVTVRIDNTLIAADAPEFKLR